MVKFLKTLLQPKLSWKIKFLLLFAFFLTGIFRFIILFFPFKALAGFIGKEGCETPLTISDDHLKKVAVISNVVIFASSCTPWQSLCMVQAVTAQFILKCFSISSTLYLGVSKTNNQLSAHAWLRSGNEVVTGKETMNDFHMIVFYGCLVGKL